MSRGHTLAALTSGALFGLGLAMSGMTDPRIVLGFLDVTGAFDPTLMLCLAVRWRRRRFCSALY